MMFNVNGSIQVQVAEKLDQDDELEIEIEADHAAVTAFLTKALAEDLADHIQKVSREHGK